MIRAIARWLRPRSNGVRVSRAALAGIVAGNRARDRRDWTTAAAAYRAVTAREPGLAHIWVQLGHMLKEAGELPEAGRAYRRAADLVPADPEPIVRLAHMAKDDGARVTAATHFVEALGRAPRDAELSGELLQLLADCREDAALWTAALAALDVDPNLVTAEEAPVAQPGALILDVSDLLGYFGRRRLPTGIQRVQIEVALACLAETDEPILLCTFAGPYRRWIALPPARFGALCRAALTSDDADDPVWREDVRNLFVIVAATRSLRFARAMVMVNLGSSWGEPLYLPMVERERAASGLAYVSFVHDLLPAKHPEWFEADLVRNHARWLDLLLRTADGYLTNSNATRADLLAARVPGVAPVDPARARVVRIDGDVGDALAPLPESRLAARGLAPGSFVLMVSTIEPRKNHLGAFAAWLKLIDALGEAAVPDLICVGGKGWLNEPVHAMLAAEAALRRKVRLLSGVADDELALLYRTCRFTLYPSLYEGWGLPISESLSHGRVPAVSLTSSMPEAGGDFAVYFDPADPADIAAQVTPLIVDHAFRATAEARIRAGYRARPWRAIARQIAAEAHAIARLGPADHAGETAAQ